jgi:hypothetical protein
MSEIEATDSEQSEKKSKKQMAMDALMPPKEPPPPVRLMRQLEVELTTEEKLEKSQEMLAAMMVRDNLKDEKREKTKSINADIVVAETVIKTLSAAMRSGKERREVECIETHQFDTNTVIITRTDTGKVVEKRAMTLQERQTELPIPASTPKPGEPLSATIGERVAAMPDDGPGTSICGVEIDGRICTREPHEEGAHQLEDMPAITSPQELLDGAAPDEGGEAPARDEAGPRVRRTNPRTTDRRGVTPLLNGEERLGG